MTWRKIGGRFDPQAAAAVHFHPRRQIPFVTEAHSWNRSTRMRPAASRVSWLSDGAGMALPSLNVVASSECRASGTITASAAVRRLTARIVNAQGDEIVLMQNWLRDRNQDPMTVDSLGNVRMGKPAGADHAGMGHAGHDMGAMTDMSSMPGMLTAAQLRELDAARGAEFDRLFLTFMMQHHRGAISMVRTLFASQGAGQDETIFKFAADVEVDQSTEIKRMLTMLLEMGAMPPPH